MWWKATSFAHLRISTLAHCLIRPRNVSRRGRCGSFHAAVLSGNAAETKYSLRTTQYSERTTHRNIICSFTHWLISTLHYSPYLRNQNTPPLKTRITHAVFFLLRCSCLAKQTRTHFILFLFLFISAKTFAQGEANWWYFGIQAGIDFNSGSPAAVTNGQLNTTEGCSTISDAAGNLLFYTDGTWVYNRNHVQMPNGFGLLGNNSSTQSALIFPKPGSTTLYYIFTADFHAGPSGLEYSIVDMTLAGGLGDVTIKNVMVMTPICEKVTGCLQANGTDYWVLTHGWGNNGFYAFALTSAGVNLTPVVSNIGFNVGSLVWDSQGYLKVSHAGAYVAICHDNASTAELFTFNNSTGQVTGLLFSTTYGRCYGIEFSPDDSRLYISSWFPGTLTQYDMTAGSGAAILASANMIYNNGLTYGVCALQLAVDGKIYVAQNSTSLGVISNPNLLGAACNFVPYSFSLSGQTCQYGLPAYVQSFFNVPQFSFVNLCLGDSTFFTMTTTTGVTSVNWNFGDPSTGANNSSIVFNPFHIFSAAGNFTVTLIINHNGVFDTVSQSLLIGAPPTVNLGNDTTLCTGATLTLDATYAGASYLWSNATTNSTLTVSSAGIYFVDVTNACGTVRDSIVVSYSNPPVVNLGNDTTLCTGTGFMLDATFAGATYLWNDNSTNATHFVNGAGTYWVNVTNGCGTVSDTIVVTGFGPPSVSLGNDTTLCAGITLPLDATFAGATYLWSTNATTASITVSTAGFYFVTVTNACGVASDSINVNFIPLPVVNLGNDTALCSGQSITLNAAYPGATYLWNTGSTASQITVNSSGTYSVQVTNSCATVSDNILVNVQTLPTVSLGNDTIICSGNPIKFDFSNTGFTYTWNTGLVSPQFQIDTTGNYSVVASTSCGSAADAVFVKVFNCEHCILVPNAFSPNTDGINDEFRAISGCPITIFHMIIYNRWGQLVFESSDINEGWNGTQHGMMCPMETYVYWIDYSESSFGTPNHHELKGNVTLIR